MKLHFTAAPDAADALAAMRARHADAGPEACDVVVALGGDGFMLQTLHAFTSLGKPIYGMNLGSVGFLMNEYRQDDLLERLKAAERAKIHPLRMEAHSPAGVTEARAFNLMFKTQAGPVEGEGATAYLRPETAQGMFTNFNNGSASAIVVVLMLAIIPIMIFQVRQFRREEAAR